MPDLFLYVCFHSQIIFLVLFGFFSTHTATQAHTIGDLKAPCNLHFMLWSADGKSLSLSTSVPLRIRPGFPPHLLFPVHLLPVHLLNRRVSALDAGFVPFCAFFFYFLNCCYFLFDLYWFLTDYDVPKPLYDCYLTNNFGLCVLLYGMV